MVDERKVRDLPLNGRNPLALVALTPAVIPQSGSQGCVLRRDMEREQQRRAFGRHEVLQFVSVEGFRFRREVLDFKGRQPS